MFKEGKAYDVIMLEDAITDEGKPGSFEVKSYGQLVVEVTWPLVEFAGGDIINVTSQRFVRAKLC